MKFEALCACCNPLLLRRQYQLKEWRGTAVLARRAGMLWSFTSITFKVWFIVKVLLEAVSFMDVVPHIWQQAMPWERTWENPRETCWRGWSTAAFLTIWLRPASPTLIKMTQKIERIKASLKTFSGSCAFWIEKQPEAGKQNSGVLVLGVCFPGLPHALTKRGEKWEDIKRGESCQIPSLQSRWGTRQSFH